MSLRLALLTVTLCLTASTVRAQDARSATSPRVPVPAHDYQRDAFGIAPTWNGLAVVRGAERTPVTNLYFLWPRGIEAAFGGDSAMAAAARAVRTRRVAAALTDAGGLALAVAAARMASKGRSDGIGRRAAVAGAGLVALSVPLHFSADGWLARAVWWHNAAFAR